MWILISYATRITDLLLTQLLLKSSSYFFLFLCGKFSSMCVPCVESMNVACVEASPCIVRTTGIYRRYRESAMQAAMNVKWQK